jgi:Xaa-Pro aminopeptidase
MNKRIQKLLRLFASSGIDSLFVSSEPNVSYLSGYQGTESFLFITKRGNYFLTDFRYLEQAQKEAVGFEVILRDSQSYPQMVEALRAKTKSRRVGFEVSTLSHLLYMQLAQVIPPRSLVPTSNLVEVLRAVKSREEVQKIRRSAHIAVEGVRRIKTSLRPGMSEKEVQAKLEYQTKLLGSEKPAFDMIVAAGPKSSMPHAVSNHKCKLKANQMLLVDMGVVSDGYHSDLTRCLFMGKIPPHQRKIYDIVLKAQERGIRKVKPGVRTRDVDAACRNYIEQKGFGKYFGHGTGHGVGLEVHEAPTVSSRSQEILEPGMVVTVEPGIYLPSRFGVRIEDMVLVTSKGHEVLTQGLEK